MILLYYVAMGCLAVLLQMVLLDPASLVIWRPELPALAVVLAGLHMRDERVYIATGIMVVFHSLFSAQPLGVSLITYGILAWFVLFQMQVFERHPFLAAIMLALMGTFVFMVVDYIGYCWVNQVWMWEFGLWNKILMPSILNALVAPLVSGISQLIFSIRLKRRREA
jgi:cell shape-determining protein MreD